MEKKSYVLPPLPYGYRDLEPFISENQLKLHYEKHHDAYVKGANSILDKFEKARLEGAELDMKAELKALSFNVGGHILHSLFWENLAPDNKGGGKVGGRILDRIIREFGSFARFKSEFSLAAASVEGSGWAALVCAPETCQLMLMQVEKHNASLMPHADILLVLDVFEHAYYLDYKNERGGFIEAFWNIVNWEKVDERLARLDNPR
ncbi:MAG: superoxide dismutase [Candidatus Moranbacteria bacterium]|nr:superoxide dismutase [Candidatus Moranbacteria bacterium]